MTFILFCFSVILKVMEVNLEIGFPTKEFCAKLDWGNFGNFFIVYPQKDGEMEREK